MSWSELFSKNNKSADQGGKDVPESQPSPSPVPIRAPLPKVPAVREMTVPGMGRVSVRKRVVENTHPVSIPPQPISVPERFRSSARPQRTLPVLPTNPIFKNPATVPLRIDLPPATIKPRPPVETLLTTQVEIAAVPAMSVVPSVPPFTSSEPELVTSSTVPSPSFRRRKMNEVAKVILPPRREIVPVEEPAEELRPSAIVPPSFPVTAPVGRVMSETARLPDFRTPPPEPPREIPTIPEIPLSEVPADIIPDQSIAEEAPPVAVQPEETEPTLLDKEEEDADDADDTKREFLLNNGERIFGRVLSETADEIYLQHESLGVLTIPQTKVAKRLLEVILINGDRVVGDVVAETTEAIYIRHTSLGVLTIPRNQRSTRVVEAILKGGDRIIGEILTETETYTVIRSAALGTVAVQHDQLSLLNRKVEQIQPRILLADS